MAEQIEVVCLVAAAEAALVLDVLLLVLLELRLRVYWVGEMCEWIGEVVAREAASVRWHLGLRVLRYVSILQRSRVL